jgi:hypothetical protein
VKGREHDKATEHDIVPIVAFLTNASKGTSMNTTMKSKRVSGQ